MSDKAAEIHIREKTKKVLKHFENGEIESARKVIEENIEILRYNFGLINFVPLIPRIRFSKVIPKSNDALKMVIDTAYRIFSKDENVQELIFFAAAKCDDEKLKNCIHSILQKSPNDINQVREGDTALMFMIKYGNVADDKYPTCMKMLIDSGVDVNRNDYFSHNPLQFLLDLYQRYMKRSQKDDKVLTNLKSCIELLLETKSIDLSSVKIDNNPIQSTKVLEQFYIDAPELEEFEEHNEEQLNKDTLFKYLINKDEKTFISTLKSSMTKQSVKNSEVIEIFNEDDGNNTFLQLCCEMNLKDAAKFLIDNGADVIKTTDRNAKTPLELAARRNHPEIFNNLLKANKIFIDEQLFMVFLQARPKHIKAKYFEEILKYKHLDVNIRSTNGNSPLHYAIIFSNTDAIEVLLKRGASLMMQNSSKKTPLDYICPDDLESYFNKCIIPDTYNDVHNGKYEIALNYRNLVELSDSQVSSELSVIEKICNSPKLCYLLNHPLISSFIDIKWKMIEPIYQKIFMFHVLFYVISILSFINLNLLNYLAIPLAFIYSIRILSIFNWNNNTLHEIVDITIAIIIFFSFFVTKNVIRYQLGVIATIFMAFSFHLLWRFSPSFSQFHSLLIKILSQLFSYLLYIVGLILFFGAAFYIFCLLKFEDDNSDNLLSDMKTISPPFYILCVFGVFVSVIVIMALINSVTFLQENSENIGENFHVLGNKHTLIFLKRIEEFYKRHLITKHLFIFDSTTETEIDVKLPELDGKRKIKRTTKNKKLFLINFFINNNKFSCEKLLSIKLSFSNVAKLKKAIK